MDLQFHDIFSHANSKAFRLTSPKFGKLIFLHDVEKLELKLMFSQYINVKKIR